MLYRTRPVSEQTLGRYESSAKRWRTGRCVHGTTARAHVVRKLLPVLEVCGYCMVHSYAHRRGTLCSEDSSVPNHRVSNAHEFVRVPLINIETPHSDLWLWVFSFRVVDGLTHCGERPLCRVKLCTLRGGDWMERGKAVAVPSGSGIDAFIGRHGSAGGRA